MSNQSLEEMKPFLDEMRREHADKLALHKQAEAAVAQSMAELIADPRWATYVRHIEALRDPQQKQLDQARRELDNQVLSNSEYIMVKSRQIEAKAKVEAFSQALELVKELAQRGHS